MIEPACTMRKVLPNSVERRHICVLTHLFPARSETFIRNHVLGLARRGHSVDVVARRSGDDIKLEELAELDEEGVRRLYTDAIDTRIDLVRKTILALLRKPSLRKQMIHPAPWSRRGWIGAQNTVRLIRRLSPDLIHVHFGTIASRLAELPENGLEDIPIVVTWHGYDVNAVPRKFGIRIYERLFTSQAYYTVGSRYVRDALVNLGADPKRVFVIPMGVDPAIFVYRPRVMIHGDALRVLSVGRLDPVKDHGSLIKAIKLIKDQGIPVELKIVGEGSSRKELEKQIDAASLRDCVFLLGAKTSAEIVQEMHDAHVFALAGKMTDDGKVESQGVVFAEAQSTGLPVVACDVGGTSDSLLHGETGFLCPSEDIPAIAEAITEFWRRPELIDEFGRRGRQLVEERFSLDVMLDRFDHLYAHAMDRVINVNEERKILMNG